MSSLYDRFQEPSESLYKIECVCCGRKYDCWEVEFTEGPDGYYCEHCKERLTNSEECAM